MTPMFAVPALALLAFAFLLVKAPQIPKSPILGVGISPTASGTSHTESCVVPTDANVIAMTAVNGLPLGYLVPNENGCFYEDIPVASPDDSYYIEILDGFKKSWLTDASVTVDPPDDRRKGTHIKPRSQLHRDISLNLNYTDPSVVVTVSLPRYDLLANELLSDSMPFRVFINIALAGMKLNGTLLSDALPLRATRMCISDTILTVHAESTGPSASESHLGSSLPPLSGDVALGVDPALESSLMQRYDLDDRYSLKLTDYAIQWSTTRDFDVSDVVGRRLTWTSAFTPVNPEARVSVKFEPFSSIRRFIAFAADQPYDWWPNFFVDITWGTFFTLAPIVVFAFTRLIRTRRTAVSFLAAVGFLPLAMAPLAGVLGDSSTVSFLPRYNLAYVALIIITLIVGAATSRFIAGDSKQVGVLAFGIAASFFFALGAMNIANYLQVHYVPDSMAIFAFCAVVGATLVGLAITGAYRVAVLPNTFGGAWTWILLVVFTLLCLPIPKHHLSMWGYWVPPLEPASGLMLDLAGAVQTLVVPLFTIALSFALAEIESETAAVAVAPLLFAFFSVDYAVTWYFIPIEFIAGFLIYKRLLLRPKDDRFRISGVKETVYRSRAVLVRIAQEQRTLRSIRDAMDALTKQLREQSIAPETYTQKRLELETFAASRFGRPNDADLAASLALNFGPFEENRKNGVAAAIVGIIFGVVDLLLGMRGDIEPFATNSVWEFSAFYFATTLVLVPVLSFGIPAYFFGFYYQYIRGNSGLAKGLLYGSLMVLVLLFGWVIRAQTRLTLVLWGTEWILMFATIGIWFDYTVLRNSLDWRFRWNDVIEFAGGPRISALVTLIVTSLGVAISELLKGEFSSLAGMAAVAVGLPTPTHPH